MKWWHDVKEVLAFLSILTDRHRQTDRQTDTHTHTHTDTFSSHPWPVCCVVCFAKAQQIKAQTFSSCLVGTSSVVFMRALRWMSMKRLLVALQLAKKRGNEHKCQ